MVLIQDVLVCRYYCLNYLVIKLVILMDVFKLVVGEMVCFLYMVWYLCDIGLLVFEIYEEFVDYLIFEDFGNVCFVDFFVDFVVFYCIVLDVLL